MKKIFFAITLFICVLNNITAQFLVSSSTQYLQITNLPNIDAVFLFNGINASTEITYTGSGSLEWHLYNGSFYSNQATIYPDDATGYVLIIDGTPAYGIWVIDYSLYPITYNALTASGNCDNLTINTIIDAPDLIYFDKNNVQKKLPRTFNLQYVDYAYNGTNWQDSAVNKNYTLPINQIIVPAPKKNITACITGDNYAKEMGIISDSTANCIDYQAIAVESHLTGTIEKRAGENELDRAKSITDPLAGSGPLVVYFESRANTPTATFFEWKIYPLSNPNAYYRYNDENVRYTFQKTGDYKVVLKTTNIDGSCFYEDSINVQVLESKLAVPNAFSPNGDGINDEFRVVFKSLEKFKITIFNRWGRIVYTSTDPSKGWDGRIGGKIAATGTYYYVIDATGTDKDKNGKNVKWNAKGHINLFGGQAR